MAGPQYGCKGDGYRFAAKFGHAVSQPLPALGPLLCGEERILAAADGVRCDAAITLYAGEQKICRERGELQMTKKGISGIPVFQMSGLAAAGLKRGEEMTASIDFLPDLSSDAWDAEKARRLGEDRDKMLGIFYLGLVNRKVLDMVLRSRNLQAEKKASKVDEAELVRILDMLRDFRLRIDGTGTFAQAQVTAGGIPLSETDENLQSRLQPGLYLAGELLDVDGRCGGYNLQWAMTSGWIAGGGDKERIRI
jgi:predicted Rossmann fold flavoprotein